MITHFVLHILCNQDILCIFTAEHHSFPVGWKGCKHSTDSPPNKQFTTLPNQRAPRRSINMPQTDVVDIDQPTSTTSMHRPRRCRFRGNERRYDEGGKGWQRRKWKGIKSDYMSLSDKEPTCMVILRSSGVCSNIKFTFS